VYLCVQDGLKPDGAPPSIEVTDDQFDVDDVVEDD